MQIALDLSNREFKTSIGRFWIRKKLGRGKSGYSYLAEFEGRKVVLKLMHNEPCPYYSFADNNKVELEVSAYYQLKKCTILLPQLFEYRAIENFLVKEYIAGLTAGELIARGRISDAIIGQLFEIARRAEQSGLNIDYFPSNFIVRDERLFYIDYECNPYNPEWDLSNWGIYYWANEKGFKAFLSGGEIRSINESPETGKPLKKPFEAKVADWKKRYRNL